LEAAARPDERHITWYTPDIEGITTDSVTISTIYSVKGLDYSTVFLPGLDFLEPREWSEDQLERLTYVAITRARYQLFIPYIRENSIIERLKSCLKK
jgi:superfamily I DNA/RNA helicase